METQFPIVNRNRHIKQQDTEPQIFCAGAEYAFATERIMDKGLSVTVTDSLLGRMEVGATDHLSDTMEMIDEPPKPGSEAQPLSQIHLLFPISFCLCLCLSQTAANQ